MLEFIGYSLVWIFAIYGFIEVMKIIICTFINIPKIKENSVHIIIAFKNCEESIESFIRTFYLKILNSKYDDKLDITIVDRNSTDNTNLIINELSNEYGFKVKKTVDFKDKKIEK